MKNQWTKTNKIIIGVLGGIILFILLIAIFAEEEPKTFNEELESVINKLSSNAELKDLVNEQGVSTIIIEYDYKKCALNCKRELDRHAIKIFSTIKEYKDELTDKEYITLYANSTLIDDLGNERLDRVITYSLELKDILDINWDNFTDVDRFATFKHRALQNNE